MKRLLCAALLLSLLGLLSGCGGGQEIEGRLFVIAMAVDPAQDGNLTMTVKALSGTQGTAASQGEEASGDGGSMESTEPGYVTLSATAGSAIKALDLLSATTPRSVDLSQLREIVINRTLAETDATLTILREIHALYEANGAAVVVVTPDDAGDFIRRQYALFGVRLSQYLEVLFEHFAELGTIPSGAMLSTVIGAMESGTIDAAAVYAAGNAFDATLVMDGESPTDRLPGHLPRTSPAMNEYLGSAIFSGPRMVGTLTGDETAMLRLISGRALITTLTIDEALYQVSTRSSIRRSLTYEGEQAVLGVQIHIRMSLVGGTQRSTEAELAQRLEQSAQALMLRLQAASCDAVGYGQLAVRQYPDIPSWEQSNWEQTYRQAQVRVKVDVDIQ